MKGLFILLFAVLMIACGRFCCGPREEPSAEPSAVERSR